ncbi:arabinogalactan protein 13-like [Aristolochia californica]|uniref:arabinogalactan protein 13-like n=1 Tax=Aristolochia californica TaxID=171875 RepID=UPI0035E21CA0
MEVLKLRLVNFVLMAIILAASMVGKAAAADPPAPSPTSDASVMVPALFASVTALLFGLFFC